MSVADNLQFTDIISRAAKENVSDLHLSAAAKIRARIDGVLVDWPEVVTESFLEKNILSILSDDLRRKFDENGSLVFAHNFSDNLRFKLGLYKQEGKISVILRYIPKNIRSCDDLNLPKIALSIAEADRGLVIVSGASGGGRTTTIVSMVEHINSIKNKNVITLEKPVEYQFVDKQSVIEQRQVGIDTPSFRQGLFDLQSMDVGVVVVSELEGAVEAALLLELASKCLVFLEMPGAGAADTLNNFLSRFDVSQKKMMSRILSTNLISVFNQVLVSKQGGGRLPAIEVLLNSNAVASAIAEENILKVPDLIVTSGHEGMISRARSLAELVKSGQVVVDEAMKYVDDEEEFKQMILE